MKSGDKMGELLEVREYETIVGNKEYKDQYRCMDKGTFADLIEFIHAFDSEEEKMDILDELQRNKVSDINIIEKVCSLLFGKYRFIAWFSLALAVFFDLSSLLAGLFIYGISKRTVKDV